MIRMLGEDVALQLVSELPAEQRDAIREHVLEDRDYGDNARDHMASEATVRKRVSRGLSALRARVGGVR
jgi:DNA-directed RNA polymerase specialized sigma24 family protein